MTATAATCIAAALMATPIVTSPLWAQGAPQTVGLVKVDPETVATAYRATKLTGATVYNDAKDSIGKIDDILIAPDGKAPYAVLAVGGFLGMGDRLVVVPYASLKFVDDRIVVTGATKDELRALPEFKYTK